MIIYIFNLSLTLECSVCRGQEFLLCLLLVIPRTVSYVQMYNEREQGRKNGGRKSDMVKDVVVGRWGVPVWACDSNKAGL